MKSISVIMPVYLGDYIKEVEGMTLKSASNRIEKFNRAINSFLSNNYKNKELIIISDGCDKSRKIYETKYSKYKNIIFKKIPKKPLFSGLPRQYGIKNAKGDIITYLDSDDFIGKNHLDIITSQFDTEKYDWVYYDDYIINNEKKLIIRNVELKRGSVGTSSFSHKRKIKLHWRHEYNHDWFTIKEYLLNRNCEKLKNMPEYCVCHIPALNIDN